MVVEAITSENGEYRFSAEYRVAVKLPGMFPMHLRPPPRQSKSHSPAQPHVLSSLLSLQVISPDRRDLISKPGLS
jgi:hypothetical protein